MSIEREKQVAAEAAAELVENGMTVGLGTGSTVAYLLPMAFAECAANADKGFRVAEVEAAWFSELSTTDGFPSGILADTCGLLNVPVTHVENACATGNDAVRNAVMGIASGFYDMVLVMGADKVRESASKDTFWEWAGMTRDMAWDYPLGLAAPANFAQCVELFEQLRESASNQVDGARIGLAHNIGGPTAVSAVTILEGPAQAAGHAYA